MTPYTHSPNPPASTLRPRTVRRHWVVHPHARSTSVLRVCRCRGIRRLSAPDHGMARHCVVQRCTALCWYGALDAGMQSRITLYCSTLAVYFILTYCYDALHCAFTPAVTDAHHSRHSHGLSQPLLPLPPPQAFASLIGVDARRAASNRIDCVPCITAPAPAGPPKTRMLKAAVKKWYCVPTTL
jgi:hypothetical protein